MDLPPPVSVAPIPPTASIVIPPSAAPAVAFVPEWGAPAVILRGPDGE